MKAHSSSSIVERLRKYSPEIVKVDKRPLLSTEFTFPWEQFCAEINNSLHIDLALAPGEVCWREAPNVDAGICFPYKTLNFVLPGVSGEASLLLSESDVENAMQGVLHVSTAKISFEDANFQNQFWLFFLTESLACTQLTPSLASLGIRYKGSEPLAGPRYLCQDIEVMVGSAHSLARFAISPTFLDGWLQKKSPSSKMHQLVDVDIDVSVEAARIPMTIGEMKELAVGEFLLPKHVFYVPGSSKSRVFLTYQSRPLFRAKLEQGKLTILEMPLIPEAFLLQGGYNVGSSTEKLSKDERQSFESERTDEEGEPSEEEVKSAEATAISTGLLKEPFDVAKVPLSVSVQLGKVRLSVKELSEMQPGNVLDLSVRPEDGVCLVANDVVFGKGSLILIGDNLGVQITEMYKM